MAKNLLGYLLGLPAVPLEAHLCAWSQAQTTHPHPYAAYRRAWQRQQTRRGQRLRRVRQGTVEPVFGNLLPHYGLRRLNVRGLVGAHKTMLLTAVAYNLKKLLKY
ncbi:transposase [Hymenobacter sp. UYAg731]